MRYDKIMIDFCLYNLKIASAFFISWGQSTAYARPRKYDALSFRIKGNATYTHDENLYEVKKNDILFVPANYDYTISAQKDEEVLVIHFYIENSCFQNMEIFTPINPDVFYRLFLEMTEVWRLKPVGYSAKLTSLFYKIVEQIEIQAQKQILSQKPKKLQEALDYLHENFTNSETSVESTARHVGTSATYLRKIFSLGMSIAPLQYLNGLRMDYAIGLLKTGYYSIEEIADLSGFNDPKYFSTLYKKRFGFPPSEKLRKALSTPKK